MTRVNHTSTYFSESVVRELFSLSKIEHPFEGKYERLVPTITKNLNNENYDLTKQYLQTKKAIEEDKKKSRKHIRAIEDLLWQVPHILDTESKV